MNWRPDPPQKAKPKPEPRLYPFQPAGEFAGKSPGRNDPCPCGSMVKFKRCHGQPVVVVPDATPEPVTS